MNISPILDLNSTRVICTRQVINGSGPETINRQPFMPPGLPGSEGQDVLASPEIRE